jgi:hypothetical protein
MSDSTDKVYRYLAFAYGILAYLVFLATLAYAIGVVAGVGVPKSIDTESDAPLALALFVDVSLLSLFAFQHSLMAREGFKQRWTRIVPEPVERSTYVLVSGLVLLPCSGAGCRFRLSSGGSMGWPARFCGGFREPAG